MKKENRQERRYQLIVTEENPSEFIKVKVNGTLKRCITNYMTSIDFENLTGKF